MLNLESPKLALLAVVVPVTAALLYWLLRTRTEDEEEGSETRGNRGQSSATSRQTVIEVKVPRKAVGAIIGRQGANIKELQEKTGTRMNFKDDAAQSDEDRTVIIRGTTEAAQSAECLIHKMLADLPVNVQEELMVPPYTLGRIIGRGGENIRRMSRSSGAKIYVDRTRDEYRDKERLITICGSRQQIDLAKSLIQEKLDEEEEFRAKTAVAAANREGRQKPKEFKNTASSQGEVIPMNETWEGGDATVKHSSRSHMTPEFSPSCDDGDDTVHHGPGDHMVSEFPRNKEYVDVYVSAVANPGVFWVQLITSTSLQLDQMTETMTRYYTQEGKDLSCQKLEKGDIVAAPFEQDGTWYRAKVMGLEDDKVDIFYLDFGDSEYLDPAQIKPLNAEYYKLPWQAIPCSLANVKSPEDEWTEEAVERFEELTYCAKWKVVVAKATKVTGNGPHLILIDTTTEQDVNINEEMVKLGLAINDT